MIAFEIRISMTPFSKMFSSSILNIFQAVFIDGSRRDTS